ncbi:unnamed protein product [Dovyalis caffra]|uniref:Uncharacterized protein n=1 Tax=Dovyalis caffra TaxID=77055 RepID=A0AAV1S0F0_9ROSI|nr:unnamed protein product [Dovyalis caffra]
MVFPELSWDLTGKYAVFSVLSIIHGEKDKEKKAVIFVDRRAMSCNLCDGTSIKICDLEPRPRSSDHARVPLHYEGYHAHPYFQSLISDSEIRFLVYSATTNHASNSSIIQGKDAGSDQDKNTSHWGTNNTWTPSHLGTNDIFHKEEHVSMV